MTSICSVPGCGRAIEARGLCKSHYQQHVVRGRPLAPLLGPRGRLGAEALVTRGIRLSRAAAAAVGEDPAGARAAIEEWAANRRND